MKTLVYTALAAALVGTPAAAADMPLKAPPRIVALWTGFYMGGQVGSVSATWDMSPLVSFPGVGPFAGAGFPIGQFKADAITGGFHAGYNHQFGNFVLGVEGDINTAGADVSRNFVAVGVAPGLPLRITNNLDTYGTYRVRGGFAWDNFLLYATGGWAWARSEIGIASPGQFAGPFATGTNATHSGWAAGVGGSYMITRNFILGVEYKHLDFNSKVYNFVFPFGGGTLVRTVGSLDLDEVTVRGSWKF